MEMMAKEELVVLTLAVGRIAVVVVMAVVVVVIVKETSIHFCFRVRDSGG